MQIVATIPKNLRNELNQALTTKWFLSITNIRVFFCIWFWKAYSDQIINFSPYGICSEFWKTTTSQSVLCNFLSLKQWTVPKFTQSRRDGGSLVSCKNYYSAQTLDPASDIEKIFGSAFILYFSKGSQAFIQYTSVQRIVLYSRIICE